MKSSISFLLDGQIRTIDLGTSGHLTPTTTVLDYLRSLPGHKGVKEGCAQGDCGACTVVIAEPVSDAHLRYRAVDSCLLFLPMLHRKQLITVENLRMADGTHHPVQQAMVDLYGSQCGFCTPGIVMSMFALFKSQFEPTRSDVEDALAGNLCRCTGYRSIVDAAIQACRLGGVDQFTQTEADTCRILQHLPESTIEIQNGQDLYVRPATMREAMEFRGHHPHAVILNGGTDVALRVTKNFESLRSVIDLSAVDELRNVTVTENHLNLGAGLPLSDVAKAVKEKFPALHEMLRWFGSPQIRNMGTLGGNLGTASPIGDTLPVLIAYDAQVVVQSLNGSREIPIADFITGYRTTALKAGELISSVILPFLSPGAIVRSYKISKRKDLDISTVSAGFRLERGKKDVVTRALLVYGGMSERVRRAEKAEQKLMGKQLSRDSVLAAADTVTTEFSPISDARGSANGRALMARNLVIKFWSDLAQESHPA